MNPISNRSPVEPAFWHHDEVMRTLADRDVGHLFRLIQKQAEFTQTQLGMLVGLSQAQVSEIMSGSRSVTTLEVAVRIVKGLVMPPHAHTTFLFGELPDAANVARPPGVGLSDVREVFVTRSEFLGAWPTGRLFDGASSVRAVGLSLNVLCQQYPDEKLSRLIDGGCEVFCLLLDPAGQAISAREIEEGYPAGYLQRLNELNVSLLLRLRERLSAGAQERFQIGLYDETVRFNLLLIDGTTCIAQPYLPHARGVSSPTLVLERSLHTTGLYSTFDSIFTSIASRAELK